MKTFSEALATEQSKIKHVNKKRSVGNSTMVLFVQNRFNSHCFAFTANKTLLVGWRVLLDEYFMSEILIKLLVRVESIFYGYRPCEVKKVSNN